MWIRNNWVIAGIVLVVILVGGALAVALADGVNSPSGIPVGQLPGTATNDNAAAGNVGELIESVVTLGTTQNLTNNTPLNVTSITLTPGDWDVRGTVVFKCAATTTISQLFVGLSDVSATLQTAPVSRSAAINYPGSVLFATVSTSFQPVGPTRWSLASTTVIYLLADVNFATSTCQTNGGHLSARRMR